MTDHTTAAQAADTNPLSDEYVNAVIQRHGYQSPETVIARLNQWIGLHGGENGVTLLMYEAHKALVKLRAPVADERDRNATISAVFSRCSLIPGATFWNAAEFMYDEMHRRAAMPRDPIADEETFQAWADRFPEISDMGRLREAWHAALASAPVAGDGKTRVPGDHLGGPVVAWDDGALSIPNRPESRADTGSTGGALAPVAGEAIAGYMVGTDYFRPDVLAAARIYAENRNLTVRTLRYADAAPQASEAVGDAGIAASAQQLVAAAKAMTKLYPHVWDRTDGSLVVFPENVATFDAAFDALRVALGEAVEDDDIAALSAQPGAQKNGGGDAG